MNLYQQSLAIMRANQHAGGAYIASPTFPTYAYCWFRDGSFIAYALDRAGEQQSARKFHQWCARVIMRQKSKIETLVARHQNGESLQPDEYLPARYTLEGFPARDDWTDFQLDGYGAWLWACAEHLRMNPDPDLLAEITPALATLVQYLAAFWDVPCYDCWEEHLEAVHPSTLAALYTGLASIQALKIPEVGPLSTETATKIEKYLLAHAIHPGGYIRKLIYPPGAGAGSTLVNLVDASLIGLAVPYQIPGFAPGIVQATVEKIEADLYLPGRSVYRYLEDTYYGGGEWLLLGAWLGWYWCRSGQLARACQMKAFIESQADVEGNLPEQISAHLLAPEYYLPWVSRWGEIANPLLWSQAMYVILCEEVSAYAGAD